MIKKIYFTSGLLFLAALVPQSASACISCNQLVREGIYGSMFYSNLIALLATFLALGIVIFILTRFWALKEEQETRVLAGRYLPLAAPLGECCHYTGRWPWWIC